MLGLCRLGRRRLAGGNLNQDFFARQDGYDLGAGSLFGFAGVSTCEYDLECFATGAIRSSAWWERSRMRRSQRVRSRRHGAKTYSTKLRDVEMSP